MADGNVPSALAPFAALYQDRILIRDYQDTLLQEFLFDSIAPEAKTWPAHAGLQLTVTADGHYDVDATPSPTDTDPDEQSRPAEQWDINLFNYDRSDNIDATAVANMGADYARNTVKELSIQAAQTADAIARAQYTNAATAGWTVTDSLGTTQSGTEIRVARLNGFTTALDDNAIRHLPVSGGNMLEVLINGTETRNVVAFRADNVLMLNAKKGVPDVAGPGTIILDRAVTNIPDRAPVIASNASWVQRVGEGVNRKAGSIDNVTGPVSYQDFRAAKARLRDSAVKPMMRYNKLYLSHISPTAFAQAQADPDFLRAAQGRGIEDFQYASGTIGAFNGILFIENNNAASYKTVNWSKGPKAKDRTPYTYGTRAKLGMPNVSTDPIGIETVANRDPARPIEYTLIFGDDAAVQYYQPHALLLGAGLLTEIGMAGTVAEPYRVVNDGVVISVEYTTLLFRSPLNKLMDKFPVTWNFKRSWTVRPDQISIPGGPIKFKRVICIQSSGIGT